LIVKLFNDHFDLETRPWCIVRQRTATRRHDAA